MDGDVSDGGRAVLGYVDQNGYVYSRGQPRHTPVGHVAQNGHVYRGGSLVGFVEQNGRILLGGRHAGYAERDGRVLQGTGSNATWVGDVKSGNLLHIGGAGLLLLFE